MAPAAVSVDSLEVPGRVSGVSFSVTPRTTFAVVGPNGSGKSTVLDAILGLVSYRGRVELSARSLAIVPQRLELSPALPLRVLDFLMLGRSRWPVALGVGRRGAKVEAMLAESSIAHLAHAQLAQLSGGELKRVLIADAVDRRPELLLLDEPAPGLDAAGRRWLDGVLASLPALGISTILVSHDTGLVARHAAASLELGAKDA